MLTWMHDALEWHQRYLARVNKLKAAGLSFGTLETRDQINPHLLVWFEKQNYPNCVAETFNSEQSLLDFAEEKAAELGDAFVSYEIIDLDRNRRRQPVMKVHLEDLDDDPAVPEED